MFCKASVAHIPGSLEGIKYTPGEGGFGKFWNICAKWWVFEVIFKIQNNFNSKTLLQKMYTILSM